MNQTDIQQLDEKLGLTHAGRGNVSALLKAIARGDVTVVSQPDYDWKQELLDRERVAAK
jgi:hypothetical protein